jgi:outer membrane receptor protein involved in Fe transport
MSPPKLMRDALLLSTCLLAPALAGVFVPAQAWAQATPPAEEPVPAEAPTVTDEAEEPEPEVIIVRGRFIPEPMRQTSEVATFLSTADLQRTGDDTAAAALTRLTGLSVVGGRFVYVRGLGDRYSSALLNGAPLPSPEPLRRQVPLDLFPSNILSGAAVQKTFSPNYPGEFGGGIIDLRTLRRPSEPFLSFKTGISGNTATTGSTGLVYEGNDEDWSGYDIGLRNLPTPIANAVGTGRIINPANFSDAQLEDMGESLVNSPINVLQRQDMPVNFDTELSGGTSFDYNDLEIGVVGVVGYKSDFRTRNAIRQDVFGGVLDRDRDNESTIWDIVLNGFGSVNVGWGTNQITATGLFVRSTTKQAEIETGTDVNLPAGETFRNESSAWYERQLLSGQLAGEHEFGKLELTWRGSIAQATREAPYERSFGQGVINGVPIWKGNNLTRFSYLTDDVTSGAIEIKYPFTLPNNRELEVTAGVSASQTEREYSLLRFFFSDQVRAPVTAETLRARVDFLFSPDNISPFRFVFQQTARGDDNYTGELTNTAAFIATDIEVNDYLRAAIGLRYEDAEQTLVTSNNYGLRSQAPANIANSYVLPAATLTWNFADDLQMRLGYSQTIARPQFRELALTDYIDSESGRTYQGNPLLTDTEFQNLDARVEYYFGRGRFITGGVFYKKIENPIEEVVTFSEGGFQTRFINAPEATLWGVEAEYRVTFELPWELPVGPNAKWLFAVNYTYTNSEVSAGPGTTVINPLDLRPTAASAFGLDGSQMQGTSPNLANLQFGWESDSSQMTLLVGWSDERIARRGLGAVEETIEVPGVNVDLVYRYNFELAGRASTLSISGRNLLNTDFEEYQQWDSLGRVKVNSYERGSSFSMGLTTNF